jgi:hypothetical protein
VLKLVSDLREVNGFLWVLRLPQPIKLTATYDIAEILLKVALNNDTALYISATENKLDWVRVGYGV